MRTECLLLLALARGLALLDDIVAGCVLVDVYGWGQRGGWGEGTHMCLSRSSMCWRCCLSFSLMARSLRALR